MADDVIEVKYRALVGEMMGGIEQLTKQNERWLAVIEKTKASSKQLSEEDVIRAKASKARLDTEIQLNRAAVDWANRLETADEKRKRQLLEINTLRQRGLMNEHDHVNAMRMIESAGGSAFSTLVSGAGKTALAIAGVNSVTAAASKAWALFQAEVQAGIQRTENAAQHQLSTEAAKREFARSSTGDISTKDSRAFIESAMREGMTEQAAYSAATAIVSARGPKISAKEALSVLPRIAKIDPSLSGQDAGDIAGRIFDIRNTFGGTDDAALGTLLMGQKFSRVQNFGQYANQQVQAITSAANMGLNVREAIALTSAITLGAKDAKGEQSKTATATFVADIMGQTAKMGVGGTFTDRMDWLMNDPKGQAVRNKLVGPLRSSIGSAMKLADVRDVKQLRGDGAVLPVLLDLLTPGSESRAAYEGVYAQVPSDGQARAQYVQDLEAATSEDPQLMNAAIQRKAAAAEQMLRNDWRRGRVGALRGLATSIMANTNTRPELSKRMLKSIGDYTIGEKDPLKAAEHAQSIVEGMIGEVEARNVNAPVMPFGSASNDAAFQTLKAQSTLSKDDAEFVALLRQMLVEIAAVNKNTRKISQSEQNQRVPINGPLQSTPATVP